MAFWYCWNCCHFLFTEDCKWPQRDSGNYFKACQAWMKEKNYLPWPFICSAYSSQDGIHASTWQIKEPEVIDWLEAISKCHSLLSSPEPSQSGQLEKGFVPFDVNRRPSSKLWLNSRHMRFRSLVSTFLISPSFASFTKRYRNSRACIPIAITLKQPESCARSWIWHRILPYLTDMTSLLDGTSLRIGFIRMTCFPASSAASTYIEEVAAQPFAVIEISLVKPMMTSLLEKEWPLKPKAIEHAVVHLSCKTGLPWQEEAWQWSGRPCSVEQWASSTVTHQFGPHRPPLKLQNPLRHPIPFSPWSCALPTSLEEDPKHGQKLISAHRSTENLWAARKIIHSVL